MMKLIEAWGGKVFHGIPTVGHSRRPRSAFQISHLHLKHKYFASVCRHKNACVHEMQTRLSPQMNFLHAQTNHIYFGLRFSFSAPYAKVTEVLRLPKLKARSQVVSGVFVFPGSDGSFVLIVSWAQN